MLTNKLGDILKNNHPFKNSPFENKEEIRGYVPPVGLIDMVFENGDNMIYEDNNEMVYE
jgi:hypothetical protein